jgi:hypothetical protein
MVLVGLLAGCGESPSESPEGATEAPAAPSAGATAKAPENADVEAPAGPEVRTETYTLVARPEGEGYEAGELGQFEVDLASRPGWHVNQDYPIHVEVSGSNAVHFEKTKLERTDAAEFGDDRARFNVAFTPSAEGDLPVQAKVSFAMCTDENCIMHDETLALVLPVR